VFQTQATAQTEAARPSCISVFFTKAADFLLPTQNPFSTAVSSLEAASGSVGYIAMNRAIAASAAKLAFQIGSPQRIALATRAAGLAKFAGQAADLSGAGALISIIVAEGAGLNAEMNAIQEGTCGL
jgi:hypothetical protein